METTKKLQGIRDSYVEMADLLEDILINGIDEQDIRETLKKARSRRLTETIREITGKDWTEE